MKCHYLEDKIKKVIGLMKDKLGGKIMEIFAALKPHSYLIDNSDKNKKVKGTRKCVLNENLNLKITEVV